jgi:hypothetical protein
VALYGQEPDAFRGAAHDVAPGEAFLLLSRYSQNTSRRVRRVAARLVEGCIAVEEFRLG